MKSKRSIREEFASSNLESIKKIVRSKKLLHTSRYDSSSSDDDSDLDLGSSFNMRESILLVSNARSYDERPIDFAEIEKSQRSHRNFECAVKDTPSFPEKEATLKKPITEQSFRVLDEAFVQTMLNIESQYLSKLKAPSARRVEEWSKLLCQVIRTDATKTIYDLVRVKENRNAHATHLLSQVQAG